MAAPININKTSHDKSSEQRVNLDLRQALSSAAEKLGHKKYDLKKYQEDAMSASAVPTPWFVQHKEETPMAAPSVSLDRPQEKRLDVGLKTSQNKAEDMKATSTKNTTAVEFQHRINKQKGQTRRANLTPEPAKLIAQNIRTPALATLNSRLASLSELSQPNHAARDNSGQSAAMQSLPMNLSDLAKIERSDRAATTVASQSMQQVSGTSIPASINPAALGMAHPNAATLTKELEGSTEDLVKQAQSAREYNATQPAVNDASLKQPTSLPLEVEWTQSQIASQKLKTTMSETVLPTSAPLGLSSAQQQTASATSQPDTAPPMSSQRIAREQANLLAARDGNAETPAETRFHFNAWGGNQSVLISKSEETGHYHLTPSDSETHDALTRHEKMQDGLSGKLSWEIDSVESSTDQDNKPRQQKSQDEATDE